MLHLCRLFEQHHGSYAGSNLIQELDHRKISSAFDQRELVHCLVKALSEGGNMGCITLVTRMCLNNVPFIIVSHEISYLRDTLIKLAIREGDPAAITSTVQFFYPLENELAAVYLENFLSMLKQRNHVRLRHLSALNEKNLLVHFEKHLTWMDRLTDAVSERNRAAMPEVHHDECDFGKWLHRDGKALIRDKSHYNHLVETHAAMHATVGELDEVMAEEFDNIHIYALLKKAENFSLDIGNEIALLNSMVVMSIYNKDPLTGTLTRRSLDRVLLNQLEISALTETPFCMVMCDLDHFKAINDIYGHVGGDLAIKHFANTLVGDLRQSDMLFRVGGDEFLIILPSTDYAHGRLITTKLCADLSGKPLNIGEASVTVNASFGLLEVHGNKVSMIDNELVLDLIKTCDQRLYMAKQRGRNQVA